MTSFKRFPLACSDQEHVRIIDAIERGDAEAARRKMRDDVLKAGEQLARWYERRSATVFTG